MGDLELVRRRVISERRGYGCDVRVQVTHIRVDGIDAYVREGRQASSAEHFALSSNARLGHKADGNRVGVEVLHLAAPAEQWDRIAEAVGEADHMGRPVVTHARWTMRTAPRAFEGANDAA